MDKLAENIVEFCKTIAPYSYVFAIVAACVVGILFAVPSKKAHDFATSYGLLALAGVVLIAGCVTLGKWFANHWSF